MNTDTTGKNTAATNGKLSFINKLKQNPKLAAIFAGGLSAVISLVIVLFLWAQNEPYGVLFSNLNDKDGGEIVSQLEKMNIPYQFSSSGSTILIAQDKVHETRLRLAQQGLPKGGAVGFELLDKDRFGMSQFTEQINYQRALEGELSRTISTISNIENARVHLALPKPSLFVRERKEPTASVTLTLIPGRALTQGQIDAIKHLISSSVAELPADKVTIVDQHGNLLTSESSGGLNLNSSQLEFTDRIESRVRQRIEAILEPILGKNNISVQVSADIDFSRQESTMETYDPNSDMTNQSIRSQQRIENSQSSSVIGISGVPGALSNQPVPVSSAPINPESPNNSEESDESDNKAKDKQPTNVQLNDTINYELNRQVTHSQIPEGRIIRLSVAVLVNSKTIELIAQPASQQAETENDEQTGNSTKTVLSEDNILKNIENLTRQSMGYSQIRGDTLTVTHLAFSENDETSERPSFWEKPEFYESLMKYGRYLIFFIVLWIFWRKILKPLWSKAEDKIFNTPAPESVSAAKSDNRMEPEDTETKRQKLFEDTAIQQQYIREIVEKDPRVMALIIRSWMNKEGDK